MMKKTTQTSQNKIKQWFKKLFRRLINQHQHDLLKVPTVLPKNVILGIEKFNFYYNFGTKQALFDINLNILKNKVTALIGPSGCGKSTLLQAINRMNDLIEGTKMSGAIMYNDKNIYQYRQNIISLRTKIGVVFQKPNPFPKSIYENIAFGLKSLGIFDKKILDQTVEGSLRQAALWDEVKDNLRDSALSLSGGQQQRLCIARAIALKPEILLMDEPTSALDPIATAKIEELISDLKKDFTIIIVTHSLQQAARILDYTAFFWIRELIEYNKTALLFSHPHETKTEDYITGRFG